MKNKNKQSSSKRVVYHLARTVQVLRYFNGNFKGLQALVQTMSQCIHTLLRRFLRRRKIGGVDSLDATGDVMGIKPPSPLLRAAIASPSKR